MAVIISLGIALLVVAFVAAPFLLLGERSSNPRAGEGKGEDGAETLQELLGEKETIYAAIQELDFDFKSGKLSAEDHAALRQRHELQAASVLRRIDEFQAETRPPEKARRPSREKRSG
jgi:hypothetical protein